MSVDWAAARAEFPSLARWTYLNTATYGQMPRCAVEAMSRHSRRRDEAACTDFLDWYADADRIRASVARLIHASPDDIAFTTNAASALATVLAGLAPGERDNLVTLESEFPNYLYLSAVRKTSWERFYDAVDSNTRLVALSEVNYSTGFRPPLKDISAFLAARGIPLFVDGSQSVGALTFDVSRTRVDVLAVHGYKWLLSPTGAGFLYVSPEFRARLAPGVIGWRSHHDWRNVDRLHHGAPQFKDSAEKYEGGGLPFHLLYAMGAAVDWILDLGPERIQQRVLYLADRARVILRNLGAQVDETGSHIVCGRFAGRDASDLARRLRERAIVVAARHGALRVSPHFYNDGADLDRLEQALRMM
jgi:selenocysteine lyase/cysteine desulfurase